MTRIDVNQNTNSCQKKKVVLTVPKINGGSNTFDNAHTYEAEPNFLVVKYKMGQNKCSNKTFLAIVKFVRAIDFQIATCFIFLYLKTVFFS